MARCIQLCSGGPPSWWYLCGEGFRGSSFGFLFAATAGFHRYQVVYAWADRIPGDYPKYLGTNSCRVDGGAEFSWFCWYSSPQTLCSCSKQVKDGYRMLQGFGAHWSCGKCWGLPKSLLDFRPMHEQVEVAVQIVFWGDPGFFTEVLWF